MNRIRIYAFLIGLRSLEITLYLLLAILLVRLFLSIWLMIYDETFISWLLSSERAIEILSVHFDNKLYLVNPDYVPSDSEPESDASSINSDDYWGSCEHATNPEQYPDTDDECQNGHDVSNSNPDLDIHPTKNQCHRCGDFGSDHICVRCRCLFHEGCDTQQSSNANTTSENTTNNSNNNEDTTTNNNEDTTTNDTNSDTNNNDTSNNNDNNR